MKVNRQLVDQNVVMVHQGSIIDAHCSTKNASGKRGPEMRQTKKGNQWFFGMKAYIGIDVHSGLVHTVVGTAVNVGDVTQAHAPLLSEEEFAMMGDAS